VRASVGLLLLLVLTWPASARAGEAAADLVLRAERAERQGQAALALEAYRSAVGAAPGSRWARRAQVRIDWLEVRIDEAGSAAVSRLLRLRALGDAGPTRAEVDELVRGLDRIPAGKVRRESRALAAGAYERLAELELALSAYQSWLAEPGLDAAERRLAATGAARCQEQLGDLPGALATLRGAEQLETPEARRLALESFGLRARPIAALVLALFVLAASVLARRGVGWVALRRAFGPARIAAGLWLFCVPLLIAAAHSPELLRALLWVVGSLAPILAWSSLAGSALDVAATPPRLRAMLAALGVTALVAGLYLGLDRSGRLLELALAFRRA
jgi:tetratricopeptide (TPR) repeat protein